MSDIKPTVAISLAAPPAPIRDAIKAGLGSQAKPVWLSACEGDEARGAALAGAAALMGMRLHVEISAAEWPMLGHMRLIQTLSAGVDFLPFDLLPQGVPVAANRGAYAAPMAEHGLAMILAAMKDLRGRERQMGTGHFNQWEPVRQLAGATVAILGYGGIGAELARLLAPFDCRIIAINRSGVAEGPGVAHAATLASLPAVLAEADVVVLTLSLNRATRGVIDTTALQTMKDDAVLVNLARGALINEAALHARLVKHPHFLACLDAWWSEPFIHGRFETGHDFLSLPNVIGSPHNSAQVPGIHVHGARRAAENVARVLAGQPPLYLVGPEERP